MKKLSILGDYNPSSETHIATNSAINHSQKMLGNNLNSVWISTDDISEDILKSSHGFLVAPGSPYKNMEKIISAIEYARVNHIPILGTCGGFQHMILEYARNILGFKSAQHAEYDPNTGDLFISELSCSLRGIEMDLTILSDSKAASLYGENLAKEKYYCSFGINPEYINDIKKGPLHFVGSDSEVELRVLELPDHPFFIGTLFVPQANSTERKPHPVVTGLLKAIFESNIAEHDI